MVTTTRDVGTLVVVILKARNLPNKRHIGKQDPYCTVILNGEKRRTKAIRRGGQHPEWDEEIRFTVYEDPDSEATQPARGDGTPPLPPPKSNGKGPTRIKGGSAMALACYAEDPREPDLIGETKVDLTEVLTKGETDEWFTLMNKEKYCGEVYLELTFWSNEPEPAKKVASKPKVQKQYGGPGSFVPAGDPSQSEADGQHTVMRFASTGSIRDDLRRDQVPPSLRPSSSIAQLDLYVPPYESRARRGAVDSITTDFGQMNVEDSLSRRQSLPPQQIPRPASSIEYQDVQGPTSPMTHGFHHNMYSEGGIPYSYPQDIAAQHTGALSYHQSSMINQDTYQQPYENVMPPSSGYQVPVRQGGPRHSIPTASSGFMPMPTPASSGFAPLSPYPPQQSGFGPPSTHTPVPAGYGPSPSHVPPSSGYSTLAPSPSAPSGFIGSGAPLHSYHQSLPQAPAPATAYTYQQYAPSSAGVSQQLLAQSSSEPGPQHSQVTQYQHPPPPPPSVPPQSHSTPPEHYSSHTTVQPTSHDSLPLVPPPPPAPVQDVSPHGQSIGSRPLPQPTQSQSRTRRSSLPIPPPGGPPGMYQPPSRGPSGTFTSPSLPYPPAQTAAPVVHHGAPEALVRMPSNSYNTPPSMYPGAPGGYSPHSVQSGSYAPSVLNPSSSNTYSSVPPPPPLPRRSVSPAPYVASGQPLSRSPSSQSQQYQQSGSPALPPPPQNISRRPYLPPPPNVSYNNQPSQSQFTYQPLPPIPPPPSLPAHAHYEPISSFPSGSQSQTFHPGPPPRPPTQPNTQSLYIQPPVDRQSYGGSSPIVERGW